MSPEDMAIVNGGHAERRAYIDRVLAITYPGYLEALLKYRYVLRQRNALLRQPGFHDRALLEVWNNPLSEAAVLIWQAREDFHNAWVDLFQNIWKQHELPTEGSLHYSLPEYGTKGSFLSLLKDVFKTDLERRRTTVGPHLDTIHFRLDGRELKNLGSLGQQKLFLATLKLVEAHYIRDQLQRAPVLLLDDLFATLDTGIAHRLLMEMVRDHQTFISTTDVSNLNLADFGQDQVYTTNLSDGELCQA